MKVGERRLVYTSGAAGGALAGGSRVVSIVEALELVAVEESARVVPLLLPMIEFFVAIAMVAAAVNYSSKSLASCVCAISPPTLLP